MRRSLVVSFIALLAGCGGGSHGLRLGSSGPLHFHGMAGEVPPPEQRIEVWVTDPNAAYIGTAVIHGPDNCFGWLNHRVDEFEDHFVVRVWPVDTHLLGEWRCTFQVAIADEAGEVISSADITATYDVVKLTLDSGPVVLNGEDGLTWTDQSVHFTVDNGGTEALPYEVRLATDSGGDWLEATPLAGRLDSRGAAVELPLTANMDELSPGTYTGLVTVSVTWNGFAYEKAVPVKLNVEESMLVTGASGVAFLASPSRSVLSRDVQVLSSIDSRTIPWNATSDQPWLTVTPSGMTEDSIHLTADPTGLAPGTHFALVTVTSSDPRIGNSQSIRVGLTVLETSPVSVSQMRVAESLAASPVEPIVFVADGGPTVVGYDVNTGQPARTFTDAASLAYGVTMSGDGGFLFVFDVLADGTAQVNQLDAATGTLVHQFPVNRRLGYDTVSFLPGTGVLLARPGGREIMFTPGGDIYEVATTRKFDSTNAWLSDALGARPMRDLSNYPLSPDQRHMGMRRLKRTALEGGAVLLTSPTYGIPAFGCFTSDGGGIFVTDYSPYLSSTFRVLNIWSPPQYWLRWAYPGNESSGAGACPWNGLVIGALATSSGHPVDLLVFDVRAGTGGATVLASLVSTQSGTSRGLPRRSLAVSGDATRLVTRTGCDPNHGGCPAEVRFQDLPSAPGSAAP